MPSVDIKPVVPHFSYLLLCSSHLTYVLGTSPPTAAPFLATLFSYSISLLISLVLITSSFKYVPSQLSESHSSSLVPLTLFLLFLMPLTLPFTNTRLIPHPCYLLWVNYHGFSSLSNITAVSRDCTT